MNKKHLKKLAAALITGVMLTGCGGGNTPSTNPSTDAPTSIEVSAEPSEETSVEVSEDVPAESSEEVSEELPSEDLPSSEEVEVPPSLKYEDEAALALDFSSYAVGDKFNPGAPITLGDFEMIVPDGKSNEVKSENKTVMVNGVEKTYSQRINNNAGATKYTFEAEKAGKLVVVARSSSKDAVEDRLAVLYDESGATVDTAELPGGDNGEANAAYACYEVEFDAAGYYEFSLEKYNGSGAGTHILDMLVYYVA